MYRALGTGRIGGMETPGSEAHMLHMQHAQMIAVIMRQQDASRLKAQRDAGAVARPAAASAPAPVRLTRKIRVHGPRPA